MKTINVTAAIIKSGDKILIAQRRKDTSQALKWEFPGGKIEPGELPRECLKREIKEELDIEIAVDELYTVVSHCYEPGKKVVLQCYLCRYLNGTLKAKECQSFQWVKPGELLTFDFAAADIPVVKKLIAEKL